VLRLQATGHQQSSDKRQQRNRLAPWRRQLEAAAPPRQGAVHWVRLADHSPPMDAAMLVRALGATATGAGMIVSVSHDDYVRSYGGCRM
jgi:hypothetical protein